MPARRIELSVKSCNQLYCYEIFITLLSTGLKLVDRLILDISLPIFFPVDLKDPTFRSKFSNRNVAIKR